MFALNESALKVLLVNPPWKRFFGASSHLPPMGLCHVAAYLKHHCPEISVELYDADLAPIVERAYQQKQFAHLHQEYVARVSNGEDSLWLEIAEYVHDSCPDVVGISVMTATYAAGLSLARMVKKANPKCKVVLGGKHATALPGQAIMDNSVDYVVVGEGEISFSELIAHLDAPEKVLGIYYKDIHGTIVFTGNRPFISNLDELPLPIFLPVNDTYDFQDASKVRSCAWELIGARGCPFNCSFCGTEHQVRTRSASHISKEMHYINEKYGITHFIFQDDSFSFSKKRALSICRMLRETTFTWQCSTRIDLLDAELVGAMKESRCLKVAIGVESASEITLKRIHKKIDPASVIQAVTLLKRHGIQIHGYFMIGFPWETFDDMKDTFKFCCKLNLESYGIHFVVPLPGTELFSELVEAGKISIDQLDWTRFQQSSYYMNFSNYPDSEWIKMLMTIQKMIDREPAVRVFKDRLRYLLNPYAALKMISAKLNRRP